MPGTPVVLVLPYDDPVATDHKTIFRTGDRGFVVGRHPRWHAYIIAIHGQTAVFFPDELKEAS